VGEQMLQGFHLAPFARLCRLCDTCLEPTHILIDGLPGDGLPVVCGVGNCTSS